MLGKRYRYRASSVAISDSSFTLMRRTSDYLGSLVATMACSVAPGLLKHRDYFGQLGIVAPSRDPGHLPASAASSCELLKVSVPSRRSSSFCGESKTVMLLSTSIVNVIKFLSSGYSSSMTFIPLVGHTCKRIVRLFALVNEEWRPYWGRRSGECLSDLTVLLHRAMDVCGVYRPTLSVRQQ